MNATNATCHPSGDNPLLPMMNDSLDDTCFGKYAHTHSDKVMKLGDGRVGPASSFSRGPRLLCDAGVLDATEGPQDRRAAGEGGLAVAFGAGDHPLPCDPVHDY